MADGGGGGILFATGNLGQKSSTMKVELPKITTNKQWAQADVFSRKCGNRSLSSEP